LSKLFRGRFAVGVIHLPRLPYTYARGTSVEELVDRAVKEAKAFEEAGFSGVLVENFGDKPYTKRVSDPLALAAMAVVVREVAKSVSIPVGVNLLRNSGLEAYSMAVAAGGKFIRVNALVEALITDSGIVEPEAPRLRAVKLNYPEVEVFADLVCKHGASITFTEASAIRGQLEALRSIVLDAAERGGADYIVVTGPRTGEAPEPEFVKRVAEISLVPVVIGSGATPDNVCSLLKHAQGVIVGSYVKAGSRAGSPVDIERARRFISALRSC